MYYGDEIGMTNARIPRKQIRDRYGKMIWPLYRGRDPGRTPMQWNAETGAGFTIGESWLPLHKDYYKINVASETADENSVLNTYRKLIALRKSMPILQDGYIEFTEKGHNEILIYTRTLNTQQVHVALNFSSHKRNLLDTIPNGCRILFSTHQEQQSVDNGNVILQPFEGIIWMVDK